MIFRSLFALFLACFAFSSQETRIAIVGATVVDGSGKEPQPATVLIKGERIEAVGLGLKIPPGYSTIDGRGKTLLPGLFDLHTHLPYSAGRGVEGDLQKNLRAYLYCGVTTTADFGTYPETFEPTRRLIQSGALLSPRLLRAARFSTPGGHGAEGGRGDFTIEVTTPIEGRAWVRRVLPSKPEVLKVFTDGWRYGAGPDMTSMRFDTLEAIVQEAHTNRLPVLTHTVTLEKAKVAARAGVDVIAHGVSDLPVDSELIGLLLEHKTAYAPTLVVYEPRPEGYTDALLGKILDPAVRDAMAPGPAAVTTGETSGRRQRWNILLQNNRKLLDAGVAIAAGSDAGVTGTFHGWATLRELRLLVEGGLSPHQAIVAATGNSARAAGLDRERGLIQPGLLADLVLIDGEPHRNISDIEKVSRVFLGGKELDRNQIVADINRPEPLPLPVVTAPHGLDDFEREGFRMLTGSRWISRFDAGHDHSRISYARILRSESNHALSIHAIMGEKRESFVQMVLPLTPGGMQLMDARQFRGVSFQARGEGEYELHIQIHAIRNNDDYVASVSLNGRWRSFKLPFSAFRRKSSPAPLVPADLVSMAFVIARPPGQSAWLELDDLALY